RVMSIDGTCLDAADTPANDEAFGRPGSGRGSGKGAYPQVRLVGLAECGTHALTAAAMGPYRTGEATLARDLLPRLGGGVVGLADRCYYACRAWGGAGRGRGRSCAGARRPITCCPWVNGWLTGRTCRWCGRCAGITTPAARCRCG